MSIDTMQICFFPYWIAESLQRRGLGLKILESPTELYKYVSLEDMASVLALNTMMRRDYIKPLTYKSATCPAAAVWFMQAGGFANHNTDTPRAAINHDRPWDVLGTKNVIVSQEVDSQLIYMSESPEIQKILEHRLFSAESRREHDKTVVNTYDVCLSMIPMVVYPGFLVKDSGPRDGIRQTVKLNVLTAVLKALAVHHDHATIAGTVWYPLYLETLSLQH